MGRSFVTEWRLRERLSAARRGVHSNGYSCQETVLVVVVRHSLKPARHLQANVRWLVRLHDRGGRRNDGDRAARDREFEQTADAEPQFEDEPAKIGTYAIAVE
ncbi:MAG: hypothetical protein EOR73_19160 [Mesorhizobium sp.]|nr:MAG: hypothetical protein EOR73_19160 [Mesorhizobium sp.]